VWEKYEILQSPSDVIASSLILITYIFKLFVLMAFLPCTNFDDLQNKVNINHNIKIHAYLEYELLRLFPCELLASKMSISGCLLVDWSPKVKILDNTARSQIEVLLHNFE